ncbi:hypothetical protein SYNTR_1161 [Candidatus Syntrophocurvum alkaliphilum]|uniref:Uncharacterized protein n=1 Tax=Candidatus Syntrophocurvum alkaliphilum TaxID=2293317 RepID=A0A6I6DIT6_9FIRM|nr:hypothetical protein [Candidatus Syntrophocurvum alkaliphilum]QGT99754.1 hypothetical protein SYNTR_1161 [Candidatus Syntrophocurvum alkaliphilum]
MSEEKKQGFLDKIGLAGLLNLEQLKRSDKNKENNNKDEQNQQEQ